MIRSYFGPHKPGSDKHKTLTILDTCRQDSTIDGLSGLVNFADRLLWSPVLLAEVFGIMEKSTKPNMVQAKYGCGVRKY